MAEKKYYINTNLQNLSKIHLNEDLYDVDTRCKLKEKRQEAHKEWKVYSEEEVTAFLENKKELRSEGRVVRNFAICKICSQRKEFDLPYVEEIKRISDSNPEYKKILIDYDKIDQFLDDIKVDVHKIVNNMHLLLSENDRHLKESFVKNLHVFDNSISKGKTTLRSKQYLELLEDHGFETPELKRKLELYYLSRNYEFPVQEDEIQPVQKQKWYHKILHAVKKNLSIIDVILGSLSDAVPGLSAASEYKETVEHVVNYS